MTRVTPAAAARQVALQASVPDPAPTCRTDPSRVEQILINLLTNAIRHTPAGSTVTVSTSLSEGGQGRVVFQVDDEGPGIAEASLDLIFDVYQTNAGEEGKGTGLGLPLSRRLARLLGGELSAVAAEGFGGRFTLQLPVMPK
ncbi:MAG: ATP-binding protein [Gemmatimonadales bacterium]|nr:MAG: ATP-binding protein [Gemmatimonadales bacterium]